MRVSRSQSLTQAFELSGSDVARLAEVFAEVVGPVEIKAYCADAMSRHFSSPHELESYENDSGRQIKSLQLVSRSRELASRVEVQFASDDRNNIYIGMEGEEAPALKLDAALKERLEAVRPWWSSLWRFDFVALLTVLLFGLILLLSLVVVLRLIPVGQPSSGSSSTGTALGYLMGVFPLVFGICLNAARSRVFPIATFLIGQGNKRAKNTELLRNLLVIGFVVSVIAGVVSAWLMR